MAKSVIKSPILKSEVFSNDLLVDINTTNVENVQSLVTVNGCVAYVSLAFKMKVSSSGSTGLPIGKINTKYKYIGRRPIIPLINNDKGEDIVPSIWINSPEITTNVQFITAGNTYLTTFTMILEKPL